MLSDAVGHGPLPSQWIVPSSLIIVLDFDVLMLYDDGWWWSSPMLSRRWRACCGVVRISSSLAVLSLPVGSTMAMAWYGCGVSLSEPGEPNGRLGNASRMVPLRLIAGDFWSVPLFFLSLVPWMDPAGANAVFAASELFCLFVDDTIAACDRALTRDACGGGGDSCWLTPAMPIDTVDRLADQKYTWERDYLDDVRRYNEKKEFVF